MISMLNDWIAVERNDKINHSRSLGENPFLNSMHVSNNYGKVVFVMSNDSSPVVPEDMVYFGNSFERIIMEGRELLLMKPDNIFAVVLEE